VCAEGVAELVKAPRGRDPNPFLYGHEGLVERLPAWRVAPLVGDESFRCLGGSLGRRGICRIASSANASRKMVRKSARCGLESTPRSSTRA
jgi:hypothetical protein